MKQTARERRRIRNAFLDQLTVIGPRVPGGQYRSGYHGKRYTVTDMWSTITGQPWLRVRWEDGRVTSHCTMWDHRRDRVSWLSVTDPVLFALALDPDIPQDSELFKAVGAEFSRRYPAGKIEQMDPNGVYTPESGGTFTLGITPGGDIELGE